MTILDGFNFWLGKQLAEALIPLAVIVVLAVMFAIDKVNRMIKRARRRR